MNTVKHDYIRGYIKYRPNLMRYLYNNRYLDVLI
jgi:hypothetical protein